MAPYGELIESSGYVPLTGFTGHLQTEASNGLIYMKGRFYSPAWHCFLNSDHGADPGSLNQYAYAHGNPMGRTDPSGMIQTNPWAMFCASGCGGFGGARVIAIAMAVTVGRCIPMGPSTNMEVVPLDAVPNPVI